MDDILQHYLDSSGRVTRWPGRKKKRDQRVVLDYLATQFEPDQTYNEQDVNAILKQSHTFEDWAMLRRELYERGYMQRTLDGTEYRLRTDANR